jgi:protein-disulfide isomerase
VRAPRGEASLESLATPRLRVPVGESDHRRGPATAPVTLVQYGDFECPQCRNTYPIIERIRAAMGDDLQYVYRCLPLGKVHKRAKRAAEAAKVAASEGLFWEMHDLLYERRRLDDDSLVGYATELGIDRERFTSKLDSGVYLQQVYEDFTGGVRCGVNGVPTFFINGERYDGPPDEAAFLAAIRAAADAGTASN